MNAIELASRKGQMTVAEIADFAADAGSENFVTAEPDVNRLLDHEDAIIRYNSLATLGYEWGRTMREDRIREILASDPDRDCRRQAAGALGSLFRAQRDHREEMDVRAFAYTAALDVLGVSRAIQPNPVNLELGENELLALDEYLRLCGPALTPAQRRIAPCTARTMSRLNTPVNQPSENCCRGHAIPIAS